MSINNKKYNKRLLIGLLVIALIAISIFFINIDKGMPLTGNSVLNVDNLSELKIKVSIPCPGHATLIKGEVLKLNGISSINFNFPNVFTIKYNPKQVSEKDILNLDIFKEYPAIKIN